MFKKWFKYFNKTNIDEDLDINTNINEIVDKMIEDINTNTDKVDKMIEDITKDIDVKAWQLIVQHRDEQRIEEEKIQEWEQLKTSFHKNYQLNLKRPMVISVVTQFKHFTLDEITNYIINELVIYGYDVYVGEVSGFVYASNAYHSYYRTIMAIPTDKEPKIELLTTPTQPVTA